MTKREFAIHLKMFANEEINLPVEDKELENSFYGYFQQFINRKEELKQVFKPIKCGDLFYDRLVEIYDSIEDSFDVIKNCQVDKETVLHLGEQYLSNIRKISKIIQNKELSEIFSGEIKIIVKNDSNELKPDKYKVYNKKYEEYGDVEEVIGDWYSENRDYNELIEVLSEAYYSILCDYNVSRYLQHPRYKMGIDIFKPYFKLWKLGYGCYFYGNLLVIQKNNCG